MSGYYKESPWTDAAVARLRELWPDPDMSCAKIAAKLGNGITRNAVIGKGVRIQLGPKPSNAPQTTKNRGNRLKHLPPKPRRQKPPRNFGGVWGTYPDKAEPFVPRPSDIQILGLTILQVKDHQCKYIPGDDGLCCGHNVMQGRSWCPGHYELTHIARSERSPAQKAADAKLGQRTARRTPDAQAWIAEEVSA